VQQPISAQYTVSDILQWHVSQQLVLTPKFQRRDIWVPVAKSYLIDSLLRQMPISPIFVRLGIDASARKTTREVVDGQQRLRSILGFIEGSFPVLQMHNEEFGGLYFHELPEDTQRAFLGYKLIINTLENVSDTDVLEIFVRINTYTAKLEPQELRNAKFAGAFKQTAYRLSFQHYAFWRNNNIFTDRRIARMSDAEFVSEIMVTMLEGIRSTKSGELNAFYAKFDENFPYSGRITSEFDTIMDLIGNLFGDSMRASPFRRLPLFYSLFTVLYDAKYGLPRSNRDRVRLTVNTIGPLRNRIHEVEAALTASEPPEEIIPFIAAARSATANLGSRLLRHQFLRNQLFDSQQRQDREGLVSRLET
jgi:hypothetical protein